VADALQGAQRCYLPMLNPGPDRGHHRRRTGEKGGGLLPSLLYAAPILPVSAACSIRVGAHHPHHVLRRVSTGLSSRFRRGAAAVMVSGCHIVDCHYINANHHTEKRVHKVWKKMERLGLDKNRLQLAWISAAEGIQFSKKIKEMDEIIGTVPREEIEKTKAVLVPGKKEKKTGEGIKSD
jgi:coenzyme F420-reducing hydrogenase delta subunit